MTEQGKKATSSAIESAITRAAAALDKAVSPVAKAVLKEQLMSLYAEVGREAPVELRSFTPGASSGQPGVWLALMQAAIDEMESGGFKFPFQLTDENGRGSLSFLPSHVIVHLKNTGRYDELVLKASPRSFKRELLMSGVVSKDEISFTTLDDRRQTHAVSVSLESLRAYGIDV